MHCIVLNCFWEDHLRGIDGLGRDADLRLHSIIGKGMNYCLCAPIIIATAFYDHPE